MSLFYECKSRYLVYIFPIALTLISIYLCILNYTPGTWLSGWDTLHPEFNFSIYLKRILQSVWQEHQGLGAVATQAHASEIPRIILLQLFSFILPAYFLRWVYFFLMLIIGPLGVYFLSNHLFKNREKTRKYSFVAGLFYLLNLGTLQHFYVPLEMFATLYGFIGWLFLSGLRFLEKGGMKRLAVFSLFTFFAAPMAHTPTLWFVYAFMLFIFLATYYLVRIQRNPKEIIKRSLLIIVATVSINAFWILPTLYFGFTHADDVSKAKITRLFTEEAILNNQEYANIKDISLLKGFLFNWRVHRSGGVFTPIFIHWDQRLDQYHFSYVGYIIFGLIVLGLVAALIRNDWNHGAFILIFLSGIFFLLMDLKPFGALFILMQQHFATIREALRLPYTKFSIPLMLSYSVFLAYGLESLLRIFSGKLKSTISAVILIAISTMVIAFALPAFKEELIGKIEKVRFPDYYFEAYNYLNQKAVDSRIATLPANNLFGWLYYDWIPDEKIDASYQGAGFTWFLSKNPILEREFDRWFPYNQDFYEQFSYAVYSQSLGLLEYTLDKYQVGYLVLDKSIISPSSERSLFFDQTKGLLSRSNRVVSDKDYGALEVYRVDNRERVQSYVSAPSQIIDFGPTYGFTQIDAFNYSSNDAGMVDSSYYYFDNGLQELALTDDDKLAQELANNRPIVLGDELKAGRSNNYELRIPDLPESQPLPASLSFDQNVVEVKYLYPVLADDSGNTLYEKQYTEQVGIGVIEGSIVLLNNRRINYSNSSQDVLLMPYNRFVLSSKVPVSRKEIGEKIYSAEPSDCLGGPGEYGKSYGKHPDSVVLKARNKNTCLDFAQSIDNAQKVVYKVHFEYKTSTGADVFYCLYSRKINDCLNKKYLNAPQKAGDYESYEDYVYVSDPSKLKFSLVLETEDKQEEQEAEFKNIYLEAYPVFNEVDFSPDQEAYFTQREILVSRSQLPVKIDLSYLSPFETIYEPGSSYYNFKASNCDNFNKGNFNRLLEEYPGFQASSYVYTAINAISCDSVDTVNIDPKNSYLVVFNSEHIRGKGLDICIEGENIDKCLIQDRLGGDAEAFILPSYPSVDKVRINVGNQSIGLIPTENRLSIIRSRYIPYEFLKGISIKPADSPGYLKNPLTLAKVEKKAVYHYEIDVDAVGDVDLKDSDMSDKGFIVLNQAFEDGWVMYDRSSCLLGIKTPLTCKKANAKHVPAKNWANGWLVHARQASYVVIFWPQYLQFVGYFVLLVFIIAIFSYSVKRRLDLKI